MVFAICLDYNSEAIRNPNMKFAAWYWRLLACVVGCCFAAAIAYSRLFLGVHSLNQIYFGALLGAWFALTTHFILRDPLMKIANDLIQSKETRLTHLFYVSAWLIVSIYIV